MIVLCGFLTLNKANKKKVCAKKKSIKIQKTRFD